MMKLKIFGYKNCTTCKKAEKYLEAYDIPFESVPIIDHPPTLAELKKMLSFLKAKGGSLKNLFNTSGTQYREMNISEKLKAGLDESAALQLLAKNGKLIKRPFVLTANDGTVGFKEDDWSALLKVKD